MEREEMAKQDLDFYMNDQDAFDALSEDDKAQLFAGNSLEGDTETAKTTVEESSATPAAAATTESTEATAATTATPEPVVLAKDGAHTIPYQELLDARKTAKEWEQVALTAAEKLDALANKPAASTETSTTTNDAVDIATLGKQYREAMYEGDGEKADQLLAKIQEETTRLAIAAATSHVGSMMQAEKQKAQEETGLELFSSEVDKAIAKFPFLDSTKESSNQDAIDLVVAQRDRLISTGIEPHKALIEAVEKVGPLFAPKPEATTTQVTVTDAAGKKAAEVIASVKPKVPTSLSEAPASTAVHHDEAEAMNEMSGIGLMNKFAGKSPAQIMELMSRVI